jgi:murein DD-endopeptidase MepM/ murein hydrolase activator NlpD
MRARLRTFTLVTAVLMAVATVFVAAAPAVVRRRPRRPVRTFLRTCVTGMGHEVRRHLLAFGAVGLFLLAGAVTNGLIASDEAPAGASTPSLRLAASSDTTQPSTRAAADRPTGTSTTPAPTTTTTTAAPPPPPDPNALVWPARGGIWSGFGHRASGRHTGTDIGAPPGSTIVAAQSGAVVYAGWESGYGLEVRIDHGGGISTLYAHMARSFVGVGQTVTQGQAIGTVGSTGRVSAPHLHFEVRVGGVPQNPMRWLANAR